MNYKKVFILIILSVITLSVNSQDFWVPTGIMSTGTEYAMALECLSPNIVMSYGNNVGLFRSVNNGASWSLISFPAGKKIWELKKAPDNTVYALCTNTTGLYINRSTDAGLTWSEVYTKVRPNNYAFGGGIVFMNDSVIVGSLSFTIGPTIGQVASEIVRSTDNGLNWQLISINTWGFSNDIVKLNDGRILATTSLGGMWYSTNNGTNWLQITSYPPSYTNKLAFNTGGDIFMTRNTAASNADLVFKSTNGGVSWQGVGLLGGANGGNSEAIYIDNAGRIYVSISISGSYQLFRSVNNGLNWTNVTAGIPSTRSVYNLAGNEQNIVFAGTNNGGVYRSTDNLVNIKNVGTGIIDSYELFQNYPNPFNPITTINFSVNVDNKIKIEVYDISGKMIKILTNEYKKAGNYEVHFNGQDLASGVYIYRMTAGDFIETKKMLLIK